MLIIDWGRVIYDDAVDGMKERFTPCQVLVVDFADDVSVVKVEGAELNFFGFGDTV